MKHFITQFFVVLGVIFLILLFIGIYFFVTDPYNLKPLLFGGSAPMQSTSAPVTESQSNADTDTSTSSTTTVEQQASAGFELSDAQVQALISLGLDPSAVPSSISPEQEACFVGVLGEARVAEIKAGAVPSAFELLKAKPCI